ncbi:hypothetical protein [Streptomyces sp. DH37]|uniref:hypothetical protein n=1 Tax=Streptomyces sp. DH37 TaxID=3040122 RepID=UPI00244351B6|nr:hypothetical protein [Streptomyces sp. DH37]MDG9702619.1 hypothetical protein [Streptomyces sp. DH37]
MNLKRTAAVALSTAALLIGGAGVSHAGDGPKFQNNAQILPCANLEVINIPILSADINNLDCSVNYKKKVHVESYGSDRDRDRERDHHKGDEDHGKGYEDHGKDNGYDKH